MNQLTKKGISTAFIELLQKRPIEDITIKDITEKCGVNRNTFYYHFSDIYSLMEWTLTERINSFMRKVDYHNGNIKHRIKLVIDFITSEKRMILNAYNAKNHVYYELFLQRQVKPLLIDNIRKIEKSNLIPEDKIDFLATAYSKIIVGLLLDWIECGAPEYDEYSLEDIQALIDDEVLERAIERLSKN